MHTNNLPVLRGAPAPQLPALPAVPAMRVLYDGPVGRIGAEFNDPIAARRFALGLGIGAGAAIALWHLLKRNG